MKGNGFRAVLFLIGIIGYTVAVFLAVVGCDTKDIPLTVVSAIVALMYVVFIVKIIADWIRG